MLVLSCGMLVDQQLGAAGTDAFGADGGPAEQVAAIDHTVSCQSRCADANRIPATTCGCDQTGAGRSGSSVAVAGEFLAAHDSAVSVVAAGCPSITVGGNRLWRTR